MWRYILEFVVGKDVPYIMKKDFLAFWEHEATIERTLRDCLKERDLPKKAESQRYKKAQSFRGKYGLKNKEEEEQFKFIFGEETYENE